MKNGCQGKNIVLGGGADILPGQSFHNAKRLFVILIMYRSFCNVSFIILPFAGLSRSFPECESRAEATEKYAFPAPHLPTKDFFI